MSDHRLQIVLASGSPRRLELLQNLGLSPIPRPSNIDETLRDRETPAEAVRRLAFEKAKPIVAQIETPGSVVIGADTTVVLDDTSLGKPENEADAAAMLERLSGRSHDVLTGLCLQASAGGRIATTVTRTRVHFRELSPAIIRWYVATGEPLDKAGAYGIQGLGSLLVDSIHGSWSNVVGLPLEQLPDLFAELGFELFEALAGPQPSPDSA